MPDASTRFHLTTTDRPVGRLALVTIDNGADHTVPTTFDQGALDSLEAVLDRIESGAAVAGLLVTGKPFIFAAGADLRAFHGMDAAGARRAAERGHTLFSRLSALPFPTVAAINGLCLGGGLELALHCGARTLSSAARGIAFPEVFLSIVPAWGGTQLAPRLVGAANALEAVVINPLDNNRMMSPNQAFTRGFADRLVASATFLDDSVAFLEQLISGEQVVERQVPDLPDRDLDAAVAAAREVADRATHGATRAPYEALDLIAFAARGGDLDEGRRREQDALERLLPARPAQASVYAFDLTQRRVRRQPGRPEAAPREIRRAAIVGAGRMGAQLGALHLQRMQVPLVIQEVDSGVLDAARAHIEDALDSRVAAGRLHAGRADFLKGLVTYTTATDPIAGADWVLEAVAEDLEVKRALLVELDRLVDETAVLATNTSSLSIGAIAGPSRHPDRVVGFHLFNPVAVLPLVEIIGHDGTSDQALATAFEMARTLGKSAVACADTPGFIVNRLMIRFNLAAMRALRQGNTVEQIDRAIEALGLPMGPFALFGLVGFRVATQVAQVLAAAFPDRFEVDDALRLLAESGRTSVEDELGSGTVADALHARIVLDEGARPLPEEEIGHLALAAVADEARRMLDEQVVEDGRDIDTAMLLGAGYPFFTGGICHYLDATGISRATSGRPLLTAQDRAR